MLLILLTFSNAFFIAEGTHPDVTAGNSITYNLSISLAKLPSFILDPAELDISITSTLSGSTAVDIASGNLLVNDTDLTVTITAVADITNFHGDKIALSQGSLTLTNAANASFSIASEVQKTFADPAGTAAVSSDLGAFTITATGQNLNYDIILTFAASYNLLFNDEAIADRESSSASPYTAPPCATANGSFTINEDDTSNFLAGTTITSATTDPINYYYDSTTPANNTNTISSITDSDGNTLDFSATFVIQECAADGANFAGGSGTTADPWQINNDLRLDLLSRLVNGTSATYRDDHYILSADIDMDISGAPWAKSSSGNGFIPIGKSPSATGALLRDQSNRFSGQLNCAPGTTRYTISNLLIKNRGTDANRYRIGLFGVLTNGAVITNCTLVNAEINGEGTVGGFVGIAIGTTSTAVVITGNTVSSSTITANREVAGGIVGDASTNVTINSNTVSNNVSISSGEPSYATVGGIVGAASTNVTINNNTVSNNVSITATGDVAGGIAGNAYDTTVSSNIVSNVSISAENYAGGLAGDVGGTSEISYNVILNTSITATSGNAGGLASDLYGGNIYRNFIAATVTGGDAVTGLTVFLGDSFEDTQQPI